MYRLKLFSFVSIIDRPEAERSSGIKIWISIWEFISVASIVSLLDCFHHLTFSCSLQTSLCYISIQTSLDLLLMMDILNCSFLPY